MDNDAFMRNQNAAVQARAKAQSRTNVLQLKLMGQSHPTGLTANLLKLFEPRPPLEFKPPPEKRKCLPYTGMAHLVSRFAEPGDPEYAPPVPEVELPTEKRARIHSLRLQKGAEKAAEELKKYDPNSDPNIAGDPYKTLFVARLNYETSESRIKREFESYGPIKRVNLVVDKESKKPRGYAFIEYMHTRDMKAAYKQADGRKIDGRRVLVDVERGRTVPNWRPRRLGGGLGTSRIGGEEINQKQTGREQPQSDLSRSEEPRVREDREKSRERGREKEREKSRERSHDRRSHDRPRDRDREDRHHRDRDRTRDRDRDKGRDKDKERDTDRKSRDRDRDRTRDSDRRSRGRDRDRPREKSEGREPDRDRGRSRDNIDDSKHERDRRDYDRTEGDDDQGYYEQPETRRSRHSEPDADQEYENYERRSHGEYEQGDRDRYDQYADRDHDHDRYERMEEDYQYDRGTSDREYRRSERSVSREYEH